VALDTGRREVEVEVTALCRVRIQPKGLGHHVLRLEDGQRANGNLVQHVKLFQMRRNVRHDHLAAVGNVDEELGRHGFIVVGAFVVVTLVPVCHHEVLFKTDLDVFDFFFIQDQVGSSSYCEPTRLIGLVLMVGCSLLRWQGEDA